MTKEDRKETGCLVWDFSTGSGPFDLSAKVLRLGDDWVVLFWGGRSHVGAVAVVSPGEIPTASLLRFGEHREDLLVREAALRLSRRLGGSVTVTAGSSSASILLLSCNQVFEQSDTVLNLYSFPVFDSKQGVRFLFGERAVEGMFDGLVHAAPSVTSCIRRYNKYFPFGII